MAGLGQGHETASGGDQNDGLRDTDVLASPTLTNFNQRALLNGVIPLTLNAYNSGTRNNTASGNCATLKADYKTINLHAGTVIVDGVIYSIAQRNIDITTSALYATYNTHSNFTGLNAADEEAILLVYFDPTITSSSGKIGLICGTVIDTSSGVYPSSPSGHLAKQTIVLASVRLHYANSRQEIVSVEDKRVFPLLSPQSSIHRETLQVMSVPLLSPISVFYSLVIPRDSREHQMVRVRPTCSSNPTNWSHTTYRLVLVVRIR